MESLIRDIKTSSQIREARRALEAAKDAVVEAAEKNAVRRYQYQPWIDEQNAAVKAYNIAQRRLRELEGGDD